MSTPRLVHTVYRVPHRRLTEQVFGALEKARDEGSLAPLEGHVQKELLDPYRHIVTGRKYLLFGPLQRDLMHPAALLTRAIEHLSAEHLSMTDSLTRLTDAVRASSLERPLLEPWVAVTTFDHGLPSWMTGEEGPAILSPDERTALAGSLAEARTLDTVERDAELRTHAEQLSALLLRCDERVSDSYRDGDDFTVAVCARRLS